MLQDGRGPKSLERVCLHLLHIRTATFLAFDMEEKVSSELKVPRLLTAKERQCVVGPGISIVRRRSASLKISRFRWRKHEARIDFTPVK
jgi:hypothetical protein